MILCMKKHTTKIPTVPILPNIPIPMMITETIPIAAMNTIMMTIQLFTNQNTNTLRELTK